MMRFLPMAVVFSFAATVAAVTPPLPMATAELLVSQLGSDQFVEREAAYRSLDCLGVAAAKALEEGANSSNLEVARRSEELLHKIRRQTESSNFLHCNTIQLAYRQVPLFVAVNDLKSRSGINLTLDQDLVADPLRPISCETEKLPPWQALEALCQAAGLRELFQIDLPVPKIEKRNSGIYFSPPIPPNAEQVAVTLADGKYVKLPGNRDSKVRVIVLPRNFPANRVNLGTGEVSLTLDVTPICGLNWRQMRGVNVTRVIDDSGRSGSGSIGRDFDPPVEPLENQMVFIRGGAGMIAFGGDLDGVTAQPTTMPNPRLAAVPIKVATPTARTLRRLEGTVRCEVVSSKHQLFTILEPTRNVGKVLESQDGTRLIIGSIRESASGNTTIEATVQIASHLYFPRPRNAWSIQLPVAPLDMGMEPVVQAFDAGGKAIEPSLRKTKQNFDGEMITSTIEITFVGSIPHQLVVIGPKALTIDVPFQLENVPLP